MIAILLTIITAVSPSGNTAFQDDSALWTEIDRINGILENSDSMGSEELGELFRETVEIAASCGLSDQFELIRAYCFETDDYSLSDTYIDRAAPGITVLMLGESTPIGVNTAAFLDISEPGSEAEEFFLTAGKGFYVDGDLRIIGTAELPEWMVRSESSAQASVDSDLASEYLAVWQNLSPLLHGYFRTIADETIKALIVDTASD